VNQRGKSTLGASVVIKFCTLRAVGDKRHSKNGNVLKKKCSEVETEKHYKGQNMRFSFSFRSKHKQNLEVKTNYFHFVRTITTTKETLTKEGRNLETVTNMEKI
jgi:hypothetical protein